MVTSKDLMEEFGLDDGGLKTALRLSSDIPSTPDSMREKVVTGLERMRAQEEAKQNAQIQQQRADEERAQADAEKQKLKQSDLDQRADRLKGVEPAAEIPSESEVGGIATEESVPQKDDQWFSTTEKPEEPVVSDPTRQPAVGSGLKTALMDEAKLEGEVGKNVFELATKEREAVDERIKAGDERIENWRQQYDDFTNSAQQLEEEIANKKITSPDIWGRASTGQKIMLGLSAIFSSFSAQGSKAFIDNIDNIIKQDIDLQFKDLQKTKDLAQSKKSLGRDALLMIQNEEIAKRTAMDIARAKIADYAESEALRTQGTRAGINASKFWEQYSDKLQSEIGANQLKTQKELMDLQVKQAQLESMEIGGEFSGRIENATERKEFRQQQTAISGVEKSLNKLQKLYDDGYSLTRSGDAQQIVADAAADYLKLSGLSARQMEQAKDLFPDLSSMGKGRLKQFFESDIDTLRGILESRKDSLVEGFPEVKRNRDTQRQKLGLSK